MKHILYFTADWCNPCKQTRPIVEELNHEQIMAKFFIIDVDAEIEMAQDFEVRSIPTFVLIKDNAEIYRVTGAQTRQQLEELIAYEKDIENDI
jgi:thioredoxin 1